MKSLFPVMLAAGSSLLAPALPAQGSPYLLGDWDGTRSDLAAQGLRFEFYHIFDVYDDIDGAPKSGTAYFGRQRVAIDLDLEQLLGWESAYIALSGVHQYGQNYNRSRFGILTNPSSIEGNETTRLANIYFGQELFDGRLHYQIGKLDGVGTFGGLPYGSSFMNDEFAYVPNAIFSTALPFDPAQKLGAIASYRPFDSGITLKGGIFDSNELDAYKDDDHGWNLDWQGPVAYAAEIGYASHADAERPGFVKLGMHYNTGDFSVYLAPDEERGNYLVYLSAGRQLYHLSDDGTRHVDASITWTHAPEDRNLYADELTAVIRVIGPWSSRPSDEIGLGFNAALISEDYSEASQASGGPAAEEEYTLELSYKAAVTPWLILQPSLQTVINPTGDRDRDTVWIAGLRTVVTF